MDVATAFIERHGTSRRHVGGRRAASCIQRRDGLVSVFVWRYRMAFHSLVPGAARRLIDGAHSR
ncbi:hypothetical protein WT27_17515 [Burkholderia territorii]|uniref:Uncharacterized protein n=1 Tax=Burkholderia territorii TaxID=1503055 RepID=A0A106DXA8_9BURK|nr:hypothetical protein WT27_17515 [Burkholderia territorii]KVX36994.1 hypothetical protein WT31_04595 [Burkholderia territorii]